MHLHEDISIRFWDINSYSIAVIARNVFFTTSGRYDKGEGGTYFIHNDNLQITYGVGGAAQHVVQDFGSHDDDTRLGGHFDIASHEAHVITKSLPENQNRYIKVLTELHVHLLLSASDRQSRNF